MVIMVLAVDGQVILGQKFSDPDFREKNRFFFSKKIDFFFLAQKDFWVDLGMGKHPNHRFSMFSWPSARSFEDPPPPTESHLTNQQ